MYDVRTVRGISTYIRKMILTNRHGIVLVGVQTKDLDEYVNIMLQHMYSTGICKCNDVLKPVCVRADKDKYDIIILARKGCKEAFDYAKLNTNMHPVNVNSLEYWAKKQEIA